ncbi:DNA-directed RNA polymerase III subunit RPC17 NDAI_0C03040 [Naumovozyma dairenensis CBS 421]|uniref:DNA-directed RNA polymerase III subunit RPC9 n=1 Tax=Naumovozyma dairenensis (strain ATCC 10597 / BCRC 20456 / CBS 421 / NBRC 0211 / NRRL Y-12639) TaxID=1071378 RepID=G0W853_NAUDC|nr:hypothetical protein NDAI_0C03040 [Naumovozyma dairenensis CBS 421]CCD23964.1 hypothetical protein NDAI_0C03040 [Naumovozyma dairenensis CBS 421]
MKVLEARDAFLSDYEVLQFLSKLERQNHWDAETILENEKHRKSKNKRKIRRPYNHPELQNITSTSLNFLNMNKNFVQQEGDEEMEDEEAKVKNLERDMKSPLCRMNDAKFSEFVTRLNEYELFKVEKLQIVNQLPGNMVHLYSIVEECDSRFTNEQIETMLSIIKEYS